ncbi:MAG: hypothetical protein ACREX3_18610, partial [Gammaproteobacteria bacterium]
CSGCGAAAAGSISRRASTYLVPGSSCGSTSPASWTCPTPAHEPPHQAPAVPPTPSPRGDPPQAGRPDPDHGGAGEKPSQALFIYFVLTCEDGRVDLNFSSRWGERTMQDLLVHFTHVHGLGKQHRQARTVQGCNGPTPCIGAG